MSSLCFHCGLPNPDQTPITIAINEVEHNVCCRGCQAAAQFILDAGLGNYYTFRDPLDVDAAGITKPQDHDWAIYDQDNLQAQYVKQDNGLAVATLQVNDMYCAACSWLIENSLRGITGVQRVDVNYTSSRVHVQWDVAACSFSQILSTVASLGYQPQPLGFGEMSVVDQSQERAQWRRLFVAGIGMMQAMMMAIALYAGWFHGIDPVTSQFLRYVSLFVASVVVLYSAQPFFIGAWRGIKHRRLGMDVPVALAIGGAYWASVWHTVIGRGEVYFDSITMFTFLLLLGRYLEARTRRQALRGHQRFAQWLPDVVTRIKANQLSEVIRLVELQVGDHILIKPGECVAADGVVVAGLSEFDEAMLTGEAHRKLKQVGDAVLAGSVNGAQPVTLVVTEVGQNTTAAGIQRLLQQAQTQKPNIALLADQIAGYFVLAVLVLAAAVGVVWWQLAPERAFEIVLSVLVVTCPCALSLATPTAVAAATAQLLQQGVLVAEGQALEALPNIDTVMLDKTGTLTTGQLQLTHTKVFSDHTAPRSLQLAAALEQQSEHPIANVFHPYAVSDVMASHIQVVPGAGVEGDIQGETYRLGRWGFVRALCPPTALPKQTEGVFLASQHGLVAQFSLSSALRQDAKATVQTMQQRGMRVMLVSGDQERSVQAMAEALGISEYYAEQMPQQKLALLTKQRRAGHRVLMVGDGINDAPILAAADVSVVVGNATSLAKRHADLILMSERLMPLAVVSAKVQQMMRVIRQNFAWAIGYNALAVPLAAMGWVAPWMAVIGMSASSLLVVLNSMRLHRALMPAVSLLKPSRILAAS